ncbi:MAG: hypothetical protein JXA30_14160 [Deltaproteobacteria bacterium]|nr:hypothetical protein [Deltaproteobacteria bacterium]
MIILGDAVRGNLGPCATKVWLMALGAAPGASDDHTVRIAGLENGGGEEQRLELIIKPFDQSGSRTTDCGLGEWRIWATGLYARIQTGRSLAFAPHADELRSWRMAAESESETRALRHYCGLGEWRRGTLRKKRALLFSPIGLRS